MPLRLWGVLTSPKAQPSGLQMTPPSIWGMEKTGMPGSPDFIRIREFKLSVFTENANANVSFYVLTSSVCVEFCCRRPRYVRLSTYLLILHQSLELLPRSSWHAVTQNYAEAYIELTISLAINQLISSWPPSRALRITLHSLRQDKDEGIRNFAA